MATVVETEPAPYVGPRPYTRADGAVFFGRDAETAELVSLVIAHRLVLLYSVSGAGKSSLLRAGLIAALEDEAFEVLGPVRFQSVVPSPPEAPNAFTYAVLSRLRDAKPTVELGDALADLPRGKDRYGFPSPRVLIVDQFEEIFTLHQERWEHREAFIRQMADALATDPELRIVIALREEYLAQLERYADLFPDGARARFHLERLRAGAALEAITRPVARRGVEFDTGVAEGLVHDLRETRIDIGDGTTSKVVGEFVEPVQLQVVCRTMWSRLGSTVKLVTAADLAALGNVDDSLIVYYDDAIDEALGRRRGLRHEYKLREELERSLITSAGTRATVFAGEKETENLPRDALDTLAEHHLLRAEWRAGGRWLELAHDRLIEPIRRSNRRVRVRYRRRRVALAFAGLVIATAAVVSVGTATFVSNHVTVPDVVGASSVFQAEKVITDSGLVLSGTRHIRSGSVEPGTVLTQRPPAGARAQPGSGVELGIATAANTTRVPNVVGLRLAAAENTLRRARLTLGQAAPSPVDPADPIASQIPSAGEIVSLGTPVDVFVRQNDTAKRGGVTGGGSGGGG